MSRYDEYANTERSEGREPLEFNEWKKQRMQEGRAAAAAQKTEVEPATQAVPQEPESMIFWAENRFRVEVMQAGGKTVINGQVVVQPHKTIEFTEHHWTADIADTEDREKAEWLLKSRAVRRGEIVVVPQVAKTRGPAIQTGPRTSLTPKTRHEKIERPASAQAAIEALSAPLN
jgi:hypothetical protein